VIRTPDGEVPVVLALGDSGTVETTLGTRAAEPAGRAAYRGGLLRLHLTAQPAVPTDAVSAGQLDFFLAPYPAPLGEALRGTVTTGPAAGSGLEGRLTQWVELIREPRGHSGSPSG
jgi:hypothetical protein